MNTGRIDLCIDFDGHLGLLGIRDQVAGPLERAALPPRIYLFERSISNIVILVHSTVLENAISVKLDKGRPLATMRSRHRPRRLGVDSKYVIAVGLNARDPEAFGVTIDLGLCLALPDVGVRSVEIVLADENHGKSPEDGKIHSLVKHAFFGGTVAEDGHRHRILTAYLEGERHAGSMRDGTGYDGRRPHDPRREVNEVHGPAPPSTATGLTTEKLGHHGVEIAALGEVPAMGPVVRKDHIAGAERGTDTNCYGFVPHAKVRW